MKKFLSLLALALLTAVGVNAQNSYVLNINDIYLDAQYGTGGLETATLVSESETKYLLNDATIEQDIFTVVSKAERTYRIDASTEVDYGGYVSTSRLEPNGASNRTGGRQMFVDVANKGTLYIGAHGQSGRSFSVVKATDKTSYINLAEVSAADVMFSKTFGDDEGAPSADQVYSVELEPGLYCITQGGGMYYTYVAFVEEGGGSTPAITFEAGAVERSVTVGLNAAGTVGIDWGDGVIVEQESTGAYDGWDNALEFIGTPSGEVMVYGEGIIYFQSFTKMVDGAVTGGITTIDLSNAATITELDIHQNNLTALDLSKLTALEKLTIGVNDFTTINLEANTELTTLDANCTADGKLTSLNLAANTKLTTLKANNNQIKSIDLSSNTALKNIYLLGNGLESIDFGNNTTDKIYISLNNNSLQRLDVTALTGLANGSLLVMNNNLSSLSYTKIKTLNVTGNLFTIATMPKENVTNLTYSKQQDLPIAEEIDKTIDLSNQAMFGETETTFTWKTEDGSPLVAGTDYSVEGGVTTFKTKPEQKVYAELSNTAIGTAVVLQTTLATVIAAAEGGSDPLVTTPAITFKAGAVERTVTVGLNAAGKVGIDWGAGVIEEKEANGAYDGWDNTLEFTGTPAGEVKVYGEGINYFQSFTKMVDGAVTNGITEIDLSNAATITELDIHQNNIATVDLSALTALTSLNIGVNEFTTLNLAANTELATLDVTNGKLTAIDLSTNTKLTKVVLSGNKLTELDLSNNPLLKTITVMNNELTSVNLGANTASKHTIQFGGNKLTSINLSEFANYSGTYLRVRDNKLTEIKLPGKIGQIWADGNAFTLAQLYELKAMANTFTYAGNQAQYTEAQAPMEIVPTDGVVDLSSQAMLGNTPTTFVWRPYLVKARSNGAETDLTPVSDILIEGEDYTVENGVFTFLKDFGSIFCEMTNAELPAFTAEQPFKTIVIDITTATGISNIAEEDGSAVFYNLRGVRVAAPTKGIYVKNGRKVVVK